MSREHPNVLKTVAVFDALVLMSPALIKGKLLLQELWEKKLEWDDKLFENDKIKWSSVLSDIKFVSSVTVPRCVVQCNNENTINELICFCNASGKAYSGTVYLWQTVDGVTSVELVFAKARLAPVKEFEIRTVGHCEWHVEFGIREQ